MTSRMRAGGVLALIAVCSALAGAALDRVAVQRMGRHRGGGQPVAPGGPGGRDRFSPEADAKRRGEMLDRMTTSLDLTAAQRGGLDSVMKHTDSSLRAIRLEMQPKIRAVFDSSRVAMLARLDQQQRAKFEASRSERGGGADGGGGKRRP
ncbi:MAG: hypothetical protein V4550_03960 [Gemmatimonadota bacterium]